MTFEVLVGNGHLSVVFCSRQKSSVMRPKGKSRERFALLVCIHVREVIPLVAILRHYLEFSGGVFAVKV